MIFKQIFGNQKVLVLFKQLRIVFCFYKHIRIYSCVVFCLPQKHLKIFKHCFCLTENCLRHIDSGDISLVNGKTEGNDGKWQHLHAFFFPSLNVQNLPCCACAQFMHNLSMICAKSQHDLCIIYARFMQNLSMIFAVGQQQLF